MLDDKYASRETPYMIVQDYIEKNLGISDCVFRRDKNGKPYIEGHPEIQFNISRSSNSSVVVLSNRPIGIDIEKIREFDFKIAERFFFDQERRYITDSLQQKERFYEIWTKKEAYLKYTGEGLNGPLNSFNVFDIASMFRNIYLNGYIITICQKEWSEEPVVKMLTRV